MLLGEIFGYIASILVFATFYMRTMVPLRIVAVASNLAFITYATIDGLTPILILHVALLPLNVLRLLQIRDLIRQVELAAREGFSVQAIVPLMQRRVVHANETLFSANDPANELYYLVDGILFLPELQHEVEPGTFLGEFALFSDSGRRTASAIARTECTLMVLTRNAMFSALLQHPRLGIHLLKLITARLLQNAGRDHHLPGPAVGAGSAAHEPLPQTGLFASRTRRNTVRVLAATAFVLMVAAFNPLYAVLYRDAVVTTWVNVVAAPIAGTVEDFKAQPGRRLAATGEVARIVNQSADRSGLIHATGVAQRAEAHLDELKAYDVRITALAGEWRDRKSQYADGFRSDLDLKVQELEHRATLLQERVALAATASGRKRTLRLQGNSSQADEDVATSTQRELQAALTETEKSLERVRQRRSLAGRGIYLEEDGKEPEWSWRSLDEIRLEATRTARALTEVQNEVRTSRSILADEQKNFETASLASLAVPAGMTIWSTTATSGISVTRGERLFTWIDCSQLLVDVPVTETMATLAERGARAEVTLEGEHDPRPATVVLSRGASSRLTTAELVSVPTWRKSDAQVIVALGNSPSLAGCPIGRRAFVRFPDIGMFQYIRAYLPPLH